MNATDRRICTIIVVMSLFMVSVAHGKDSNLATTTGTNSSKGSTTDDESSKKQLGGEAVESGGIFPIGKFHAVIKEERAEVFSEIDKERKATLAYLTQERSAVMDELEKELNRATDLLQSERRATMVEMEAIGNRIVENAILKSERLIDHFFIRAIQMALIILALCLFGVVMFRTVAKKKSDPS